MNANPVVLAQSVKASAESVGLSERTMRRLIRAGEVPSLVLGRRRLVRVADLEQLLLAKRAS
jgi:excisionase family DNA binding protein